MIRVKEKYVVFWIVGLLTVVFLYFSTMSNFLQAITNATVAAETLLWIFTAWVFHKISMIWFKVLLDSLVWEKS